MTSISERLLGEMIREGIVPTEDKGIYLFGIKELFSQVFTYSVMFAIGFSFDMVIEAMAFAVTYRALRIYAGGYHAATQFRCYVLTFGMIIAAMMLIRWINISETILLLGVIMLGGVIYYMSPSEHKNKPLSQNEKKVYKQKVGKRVIVSILLSLVVAAMGMSEILNAMGIAMLFLAFMMICNRRNFRKDEEMNRLLRHRHSKWIVSLLISLLVIQCCLFTRTDLAYAEGPKDTYIIIDTDGSAQTVDLSSGEAANMKTDESIQCIEKDFTMEAPVETEWDMVKPVSNDWNLQVINADNAIASQQIKVAVLDSGIDMTDNIDVKVRKNFITERPVETPLYEDLCGHGTSVASLIAGIGADSDVQGVGRNIELYSARVLDENKQAPVSRVVEAIYWAIAQDVDIINISFGTQTYSEALKTAVDAATEKGILVVAAGGNHGNSSVDYPAAFDSVLAVGATNAAGEISSFSSRGEAIDVVAPGEAVLAQGNFGEDLTLSGTSLSAPHVTGVAALLWSKDTTKPATFIKTLIKLSAKNLGTTGSGFGLVDYDYALELYDEVAVQFEDIAVGSDNAVEEETPSIEVPSTDAPVNDVEHGETVENAVPESAVQKESPSAPVNNENQDVQGQEENIATALVQQQESVGETAENTPVEEGQAKPENDVDMAVPDINSKEFEDLAIKQIDVVENTAKVEDLSDPIVDGSWKSSVHELYYDDNMALKDGATYPDNVSFLSGMTSHPEFHGYSWHNNPSATAISSGTCNYMANYKFLVKIALAYGRGEGYTAVSRSEVKGLTSTCYTAIRKGLQGIIDKDNSDSNKSNNKIIGKGDSTQRAFVFGIAMHVASDVFAHSAFQKEGASWVRILHPAADNTGVAPKRYTMAKAVMSNVLDRHNKQRSGIDYCHDFHVANSSIYNSNLGFRITKFKQFAEDADVSDPTILSHYHKVSVVT